MDLWPEKHILQIKDSGETFSRKNKKLQLVSKKRHDAGVTEAFLDMKQDKII